MTKYDDKCLELIGTTLKDEVIKMIESDGIKEYLDTMARFNNYSFNNLLLIRYQCPIASMVCAHSKWVELGGHAKKGSKAIRILAPITKKKNVLKETDDGVLIPAIEEYIIGWRTVPVFDISQIEGAKMPSQPDIIKELDGDIMDFDRIYPMLQSATTAPIGWMDEDDYKKVEDDCHGYYNRSGHFIRIRKEMSQAQVIKTTIHEVAHSLLHSPEALKDRCPSTMVKEMEAESAAYVVCKHFGLDTSDYSLGYISTWGYDILKKDRENGWSQFAALLERVLKVSKRIIDAIDPPEPPKSKVSVKEPSVKKAATKKRKEKLTFVCVSKPASTGKKTVGVIPKA
jgi:hypothetical protein